MATTQTPASGHCIPTPVSKQPVKKQSKWSPEDDVLIVELRGSGMTWEDISKHFPGRSSISCRLHYQNYLERGIEWDEERKTKLARLYERFKPEMWAMIAKEMAIPWRAVESMHWQLGEVDMAHRAGVIPFSPLKGDPKDSPIRRDTQSQTRLPVTTNNQVSPSCPVLDHNFSPEGPLKFPRGGPYTDPAYGPRPNHRQHLSSEDRLSKGGKLPGIKEALNSVCYDNTTLCRTYIRDEGKGSPELFLAPVRNSALKRPHNHLDPEEREGGAKRASIFWRDVIGAKTSRRPSA